MKLTVPEPAALAQALAGRLDRLEAHLDGIDRDVTALGRGLGGVSAVLRDLTTTITDPDRDRAAANGAGGMAEPPVCWVDAYDTDLAAGWLLDVHAWAQTRWDAVTGAVHLAPCWPWHPRAVTELLAMKAAHAAAYALGPLLVVDFEHRHLPDGIDTTERVLRACTRAGTHVDAAGAHYATAPTTGPHAEATLTAVAIWWATDRAGDPPGITPAQDRQR